MFLHTDVLSSIALFIDDSATFQAFALCCRQFARVCTKLQSHKKLEFRRFKVILSEYDGEHARNPKGSLLAYYGFYRLPNESAYPENWIKIDLINKLEILYVVTHDSKDVMDFTLGGYPFQKDIHSIVPWTPKVT